MTSINPSADYWIDKLKLERHVEGGSFREIYRSPLILPREALSIEHHGNRNIATSIYFMLEQGQFSALHKIASDEQWHFYFGGTLIVYEIESNGNLTEHKLGNHPDVEGTTFQAVVKAGSWFGSRPASDTDYSIVGCTVSPGFDFEDFELAERSALIQQYPQHKDLITALTH